MIIILSNFYLTLTALPANKKGTEKETFHFFFSTFAVYAYSIY